MEGLEIHFEGTMGIETLTVRGLSHSEGLTMLSAIVEIGKARRAKRQVQERTQLVLADEYGPPND